MNVLPPEPARSIRVRRISQRFVTASAAVSLVAGGVGASAMTANASALTAPKVATRVMTYQSTAGPTLTTNPITTDGPQLLVAYLASDSARTLIGGRFDAVSGCGLQWIPVIDANRQAGPSSIWTAVAPIALSACRLSARRNFGSWTGSAYVVGYTGAAGIGARAASSAPSGAPSVTVLTTREQSLVAGVGVDWDRAIPRQPAPGQNVNAQTLTTLNDTYWFQSFAAPISALTKVNLSDTGPTGDRYNFAAVEILAKSGTAVASPAAPTSSTTTVAPTSGSAVFPDASNTGVPDGTALSRTGSLTLSTPGAVVEGKDVAGTVSITASNVTFRRSRVAGSGFSVIRVKDGLTGVRIEDVTVDGLGRSGSAGSMGIMGPATVLRSEVTGVENGFSPGSGSLLQDNWVHALSAPGSPHIDGVQMDGDLSNIRVIHNTVDLREWTQTAAVMIDNYSGPITNISIDRNRLMGGGYTVYSDGQFNGGSITGVSFTNNSFAKGIWGYSLIRNNTQQPVWSGNVIDGTSTVILR